MFEFNMQQHKRKQGTQEDKLLKRIRDWWGQMKPTHSNVTVQYSKRYSLASCIVSRSAGLTQGFRLHAVSVISPPSGRVGRGSSQHVTACWMDLRVGGLPLHLANVVWMLSLSSPSHRPHRDQTAGQLWFSGEWSTIRCYAPAHIMWFVPLLST